MIPMTSAVISETAVHVDTTAVDVDTMVCNPELPMRVDSSETVVHGSDVTVKSATMETAAVEAATIPSASSGVSEIWLTEDSCAQ